MLRCVFFGFLARPTSAADWSVGMESRSEVADRGGRFVGEVRFETGRDGKCAELRQGGHIAFRTPRTFEPRRGTIDFWVRPSWSGADDSRRRCFLHMQKERTHLTLFKTEGGTMRFAYRGADTAWFAVDAPLRHWEAGKWYRVTASWQPFDGDSLVLVLRVDDTTRFAVGATPFVERPPVLVVGTRGGSTEPADAAMDSLIVSGDVLVQPPFRMGDKGPLTVRVDASRQLGPLRRVHDFTTPWNSRENPLPFREGDAYQRRFREAGFSLARLVAFSDTWLWGTKVERDANGAVRLDFTDFDRLTDWVTAAGARPYIRLAYNMPRALSSLQTDDLSLRHKAAYSPPLRPAEWDALMGDIVRHCNTERRLGVKYFVTTLNEADIAVRRGECDWDMICDLHARTVRVVRNADPSAKVGGPALAADPRDAGKPYMRRFLAYCAREKLPLDFICFHGYRKGHPREYGEMVDVVREMVREEYPSLSPEPEYFLDEFNLWMRDKRQDNAYAAAYITAAEHYMRRAGIAKVSLVSFNHFLPTHAPAVEVVSHTGAFHKTTEQSARFLARTLVAGGVEKKGILAHPPSTMHDGTYTYGRFEALRIPKDRPRLNLFTGLAIKPYPKMDGVTFRVVVRDGASEETLLDIHQREVAWRHRAVDLSAHAGRVVDIELRTLSGPPGSNSAADWGAWGEPRIVSEGGGEGIDLAKRLPSARTGARHPGYRFRYDDDAIRRYTGLPLIKGPVVTTPYFAIQMHSMLKSGRLPVAIEGQGGIAEDDSAGILASADNTGLAILAWRFDLGSRQPRTVKLTLQGLKAGDNMHLTRYLIDSTHTNPYHDYIVRGEDTADGRYNLETGALDVVRSEKVRTDADGRLDLAFDLEPTAVTLLVLED